MNILLILNFETGDHEYPYDTIPVIIHEDFDTATLEDSFASYFESTFDSNNSCLEDENYEISAENILNASGLKWSWLKCPFTCDKFTQMYI